MWGRGTRQEQKGVPAVKTNRDTSKGEGHIREGLHALPTSTPKDTKMAATGDKEKRRQVSFSHSGTRKPESKGRERVIITIG